jgi:hypothetical protein
LTELGVIAPLASFLLIGKNTPLLTFEESEDKFEGSYTPAIMIEIQTACFL